MKGAEQEVYLFSGVDRTSYEHKHEIITPTAAGSLWINRNSIYHMSLTLTYEDEATTRGALSRGGDGAVVLPVVPRR